MNNQINKILITFTAIFGAIFFFTGSVFAAPNDLVVQFQNSPLFSEANFAPGQSVTRWVKVTNNSGSTQKIIVDTINKNDPNHLADQLNVVIKQGEVELYSNTLTNFFIAERYLSDLMNGVQTQYDFTITFNSDAGNDYKGRTLGFDFIIGFLGQEGQQQPTTSGTITGGAGLPPGLTISNKPTVEATETSVTISWLTSYASTSQVIYALEGESHVLDLSDTSGTPPKYGYAHTTPESNISPRVTFHTVTIYGLTPGTTYYYRAVSHGSLAISQEYSFVTKGVAGATTETNVPTGETQNSGQLENAGVASQQGESGVAGEGQSQTLTPGAEGADLTASIATEGEEKQGENSNTGFLASLISMPWNLRIMILIILFGITLLLVLWFTGKLKRKKNTI